MNFLLIFVALVLSVSLFTSVYAISDSRYLKVPDWIQTASVVKMLALQGGVTELAIIFAANGSYTSQSATIKASIDNTTFFTVDTVSLAQEHR